MLLSSLSAVWRPGGAQGSQFDGVVARADLNGDGRVDYVLSDAKVICQGVKPTRRTEHRAVKIVIGTRDGRGRLAYEGEATYPLLRCGWRALRVVMI